MKPIISVVIPFYNAEQKLEATVDKIVSSTSSALELILVNDQSTDRSPELAQKLQSKHPFLKVIHLEENSGAGIARNTAIPHCTGEYVLFFDSDDSIHPGALDKLINIASEHCADLVVAAYEVTQDLTGKDLFMPAHDSKIFDQLLEGEHTRVISDDDVSQLIQTFNYPWNKIFRTSFLKENQILFGRMRVQNDVLAHWMGLALSKKTCLTSEKICTHYKISTSGSITTIFDQRRFQIFESLNEVKAFLDQREGLKTRLKKPFAKFTLRLLYWVTLNMNPHYLGEWKAVAEKGMTKLDLIRYMKLSNAVSLGSREVIYSLSLRKDNSLFVRVTFKVFENLKRLKMLLR